MEDINMNLIMIFILLSLSSGCASFAALTTIQTPEHLKQQPLLNIVSDGGVIDFREKGTFDVADELHGKFKRLLETGEETVLGEMITISRATFEAEVIRNASNEQWDLDCVGEIRNKEKRVEEEPFRCQIAQQGKAVGEFVLVTQSNAAAFSLIERHHGHVQMQKHRYTFQSIHMSEAGGSMENSIPFGYLFYEGSSVVAVVQTHGDTHMRLAANLSLEARDALILAGVASALSWKPEAGQRQQLDGM